MSVAEAQAFFANADFDETAPAATIARQVLMDAKNASPSRAPLVMEPGVPETDFLTPVAIGQPETPAIPVAPPVDPVIPPVAPVENAPVVELTNADKLQAWVRAGVPEAEAARILFGAVAPVAPAPDVPVTPPPAQVALTTLEAELAVKMQEFEDAKYNDEDLHRVTKELQALTVKRQDLVVDARMEQMAIAEQTAFHVEQQRQAAEQAEWDGIVNRVPAAKASDSSFMKAYLATQEGIAQSNPEMLTRPNFRTLVANIVLAANPSLANQPAAPATPKIPVPPAQPVAQFNPASTPGSHAPGTPNVQMLSVDQLEDMSNSPDPAVRAQYSQIRSATLAALRGR